jgi:hypothetical protein
MTDSWRDADDRYWDLDLIELQEQADRTEDHCVHLHRSLV